MYNEYMFTNTVGAVYVALYVKLYAYTSSNKAIGMLQYVFLIKRIRSVEKEGIYEYQLVSYCT